MNRSPTAPSAEHTKRLQQNDDCRRFQAPRCLSPAAIGGLRAVLCSAGDHATLATSGTRSGSAALTFVGVVLELRPGHRRFIDLGFSEGRQLLVGGFLLVEGSLEQRYDVGMAEQARPRDTCPVGADLVVFGALRRGDQSSIQEVAVGVLTKQMRTLLDNASHSRAWLGSLRLVQGVEHL